MEDKVTCIICPVGCEVTVNHEDRTITKTEGNQCKKGIGFAEEELFDPKRTLTSSVIVKNGVLPLVSVKTSGPIPKDRIFDVMDCISNIEVEAPIALGDVISNNVLGLDVDLVATRRVKVKK